MNLGLNREEIRRIREFFKKMGREPSETELQTIGQTWSEHCFHKVFKSKILFEGVEIPGLFRSFIRKATEELSPKWLVSAFEDNAGLIDFDKSYWVAAKVETHNHPSAVDPFGGAATGVGGVIRDILGVWAEPIANTDVLCFSDPGKRSLRLPKGAKSSEYLMKGVVAGIGSYGNNMGIPTVNGAVCFDDSYAGYTLVFCGCVGVLKSKNYSASAKSGDYLLLAGSRTGREGIHGVNFASGALNSEKGEMRSAVQIPNPIEEEKLKRAISQISAKHLASAINDLGGGGLSSAVSEIAKRYRCGANVDLASVSTSSSDLSPWEIWVSETQERMLLIVPEKTLSKVLSLFEHEEVEAVAIGRLVEEQEITLNFRSEKIANLPIDFLFSPPLPTLRAGVRLTQPKKKTKISSLNRLAGQRTFSEDLIDLLQSSNIASKEAIIRTYDHEVQGNTVVRPLQSPFPGPNDAAVLKPLPISNQGLAISCGINPEFSAIDPYWMTASVIDEAIRNNVAVGGRRIALLDNFAWGSPEDPSQLHSLVRSVQACYKFAKDFGTPFVSGKDSFYNETELGPITPTLLITALGIVPEIANCVTGNFKEENSSIYIAGLTFSEMGGTEYFRLKGLDRMGEPPKVDANSASALYGRMNQVMDQSLVLSCHDCSNGGLAVALAEMCFANRLGCIVDLAPLSHSQFNEFSAYEGLFSESNSRLIIEVPKQAEAKFEEMMTGSPVKKLGRVTGSRIAIEYRGQKIVDLPVSKCYGAWTGSDFN